MVTAPRHTRKHARTHTPQQHTRVYKTPTGEQYTKQVVMGEVESDAGLGGLPVVPKRGKLKAVLDYVMRQVRLP